MTHFDETRKLEDGSYILNVRLSNQCGKTIGDYIDERIDIALWIHDERPTEEVERIINDANKLIETLQTLRKEINNPMPRDEVKDVMRFVESQCQAAISDIILKEGDKIRELLKLTRKLSRLLTDSKINEGY